MKKNLIINNAMAIAAQINLDGISNHVSITFTDINVEVTIFFKLHDEKVKSTYNLIRKSCSYKPKFDNNKFYDGEFETLTIEWEF